MGVTKRKREILKAAREICPEATLEVTGGSHGMITIIGPNGSRKVFCPLTPSDHRNDKNTRRDLMQAARAVGAIPERTPAALQ